MRQASERGRSRSRPVGPTIRCVRTGKPRLRARGERVASPVTSLRREAEAPSEEVEPLSPPMKPPPLHGRGAGRAVGGVRHACRSLRLTGGGVGSSTRPVRMAPEGPTVSEETPSPGLDRGPIVDGASEIGNELEILARRTPRPPHGTGRQARRRGPTVLSATHFSGDSEELRDFFDGRHFFSGNHPGPDLSHSRSMGGGAWCSASRPRVSENQEGSHGT
jgi:hypothetical protein